MSRTPLWVGTQVESTSNLFIITYNYYQNLCLWFIKLKLIHFFYMFNYPARWLVRFNMLSLGYCSSPCFYAHSLPLPCSKNPNLHDLRYLQWKWEFIHYFLQGKIAGLLLLEFNNEERLNWGERGFYSQLVDIPLGFFEVHTCALAGFALYLDPLNISEYI